MHKRVPLTGASIVRAVSTPTAISGGIPLGIPELTLPNGDPAIKEWGCGVVAFQTGQDPVFGIVDDVSVNGDMLQIQAGGFAMYPKDMPWMGLEFAGIQVDPMDQIRRIWDHLQSYENGDLYVTVDGTTSPVRIGTEAKDVSFTTGTGELVEFEAGPFRLARWNVDDLGNVIDRLADETPFAYREHSAWDGEGIVHRLELGYPGLGVRRYDVHFEIGINAIATPPTKGGDYASEVWMQGAGEGRDKLKTSAHITTPTDRLRRVHVETDKSVRSQTAATRAGWPILNELAGHHTLESLQVVDHEFAPYGTFDVGDEVRVVGDAGWIQLNHWVRITQITDECDTGRRTIGVETV